jgi:hypothetical protein
MEVWMNLYPAFNISRIFFYLTQKCSLATCISSLSHLDTELVVCLVFLYITPAIYMCLGIYFYEVIPQQYGVKKHPLFFIKNMFAKKVAKSDIEDVPSRAMSTDDEINFQMQKVRQIGNDRSKYPLVVDGLTKIYQSELKKKKNVKRALDELFLVLKKNEIFGLLGYFYELILGQMALVRRPSSHY